MDAIPARLKLPLFLTARVSYRPPEPKDFLYKHISKSRKTYVEGACKPKTLDADSKKNQSYNAPCIIPRPSKISRDLTIDLPWQLPPNRYSAPAVPYARLKGSVGSYWLPLRKQRRPKVVKTIPDWKFYDRPSEVERLNDRDNRHKGIFLYNLRKKRPTLRCMVNDLSSCYKNPREPSATTYYYKHFELSHNVGEKVTSKRPNPHEFLRYSCVPAKMNINHKRHISFLPGPGRYETRYRIACGCLVTHILRPDIDLAIEREKRLKFRKLPYDKIKASLYCSPQWHQVPGKGHGWLFKNIPPKIEKAPKKSAVKKPTKDLHLYADAEYLHMIMNPLRRPLSTRPAPLRRPPTTIRYNCLAKRVARKQLRNNKKLAFGSGQERFKDMERPPVLTLAQREAAKASLPPERRLHDRPVTKVPIRKIKPRVYEAIKPSKPLIELARKPFRFLQAPMTKLLVTEKDLRPSTQRASSAPKPNGFFMKTLVMEDYFKDEYKNRIRK